jgi:hypothetical protein
MWPNNALQATATAPSSCGRLMIFHCHFSFLCPAPVAVPELGR